MEQFVNKTGTGRRTFTWLEIPFRYRFITAFLAPITPTVIVSLVLFSLGMNDVNFGTLLFSSILEAVLMIKISTRKLRMAMVFTVSIVIAFILDLTTGFMWQYLFTPVLLFIVLYRMIKVIQSESVTYHHRSIFLHDLGFVVLSVLLLGLISSSTQKMSINAQWIVLMCSGAVIGGRTYLSWHLERLDSEATRKLQLTVVLAILCTILALMLFLVPAFFSLFLKAFAAALLLLFMIVYRPILGILNWTIRHGSSSFKSNRPQSSPIIVQHLQSKLNSSFVSSNIISHLAAGVGIALFFIAIILLYFYISKKWRNANGSIKQGVEESESVSRMWTWRKKRLCFEKTNDKERIRYQNWLNMQHIKGYTIGDAETPREFLNRLPDKGQGVEVTARYERTQYGLEKQQPL